MPAAGGEEGGEETPAELLPVGRSGIYSVDIVRIYDRDYSCGGPLKRGLGKSQGTNE